MHLIKFLQSIVFAIAVIGFANGCSPSESEIVTPGIIKKIEAYYSQDGIKAKFIKVHSLTGGDADFIMEAIIERKGKKYLTPVSMIKIVDGKPVLAGCSLEGLGEGAISLLTEL